jgi:hypothetical protein
MCSHLFRQKRKFKTDKMAKTRKTITVLMMFTAVIILMAGSGCKKDDETTPAAKSITYNLKAKDVLGVSGTVTFTETSSTSTTIKISLTNASAESHPAQLVTKSAVETGSTTQVLTPVDATGKSSTVVTMTYAELIAYDGHINVLKSAADPLVIIAQGDIGGNALTTTNKTYNLTSVAPYVVTGTAKFEKRANGNSLVTISIANAVAGVYPATINLGSIATIGGGPVKATLTNVIVSETTGISYTNIRTLDNLTPITYDNWLVYDGYINIYQTSIDPLNIICHGNIGSN